MIIKMFTELRRKMDSCKENLTRREYKEEQNRPKNYNWNLKIHKRNEQQIRWCKQMDQWIGNRVVDITQTEQKKI